jgi:hypothetical protein
MVGLMLYSYLLDERVEPEESTIADGFVEVLARLELEYDLPPDVRSVAEDVLQALKARNANWTAGAFNKLAQSFCKKSNGPMKPEP